MKIRTSFVSNSSSSSFVCLDCDEKMTGMDLSLSDAYALSCAGFGHEFCEVHALGPWEDRYEVPEEVCPICQFKAYCPRTLARFLEKKYALSRDEVFSEIKKVNKRRRKLYDEEYVEAVCKKEGLSTDSLLEEFRANFKDYAEFVNSF